MEQGVKMYQNAVDVIKTAILQSQARAAKAVNQEQLALYFGIGRYISANTRNKHWGGGMIKSISQSLRNELPGLRGFSETNLKNMRTFYEAWNGIETNSSVTTDEITNIDTESAVVTAEIQGDSVIHKLQLVNLPDFPYKEACLYHNRRRFPITSYNYS